MSVRRLQRKNRLRVEVAEDLVEGEDEMVPEAEEVEVGTETAMDEVVDRKNQKSKLQLPSQRNQSKMAERK